ncbi:hypothetical protein J437_LFUL011099 [Ladona fulva]|uniref:CLIP domain-containing serine protease n=1 Tax=Ladona fulva TaxID=123851 RepID=A0A8K0KLN1_LADFU|nr:hypothetical protein J437_LFUL011099 [Ladona fulva]
MLGLKFLAGDTCSGAEGRNGVCQLLRDCPGVQDGIKKGIRPEICGFQGREPIICCPAMGIQSLTSRVPGETAGKTDDGSSNLLKVRLDIYELSVCQKAYEVEIRSTNQLRRGIVNTMLCAGVLEGKRDTCQGDSGGPLQYATRRKCLYEVWGVTSFGKVCAFPNSPSIYSKVFEYIPWIEDIVWPA